MCRILSERQASVAIQEESPKPDTCNSKQRWILVTVNNARSNWRIVIQTQNLLLPTGLNRPEFDEHRIIIARYPAHLWCYRMSQEDCAPQKIHSRLLRSIRFSFFFATDLFFLAAF